MIDAIKTLARAALGGWSAYRIFERHRAVTPMAPPLSTFRFGAIGAEAVANCPEPLLSREAWYCGNGAHAFACYEGVRIVALCFYWHGERYLQRNFWPLGANEAKLVQIVTAPDMRGRGIARSLIEHSAQAMLHHGFERLYARVWLTNQPSRAAFAAAGWRQIALVIEVNPFRQVRPLRINWGQRPKAST